MGNDNGDDPANARASRAAYLLETAAHTIRQRALEYNRNGINFDDYRLGGLESTWQDILECFVRLWNSKNPDKAIDWIAYSALQAAFVEAGMPQSRFSPIFGKYIEQMYANIKEDEAGDEK